MFPMLTTTVVTLALTSMLGGQPVCEAPPSPTIDAPAPADTTPRDARAVPHAGPTLVRVRALHVDQTPVIVEPMLRISGKAPRAATSKGAPTFPADLLSLAEAPATAPTVALPSARQYLDRDLAGVRAPTATAALRLGAAPRADVPFERVGDASLSPEVAARELRVARDGERVCYETVRRDDPSLHGTADVDAVVGRSGSVDLLRVHSSDLDPAILPCIANSFVGLRFAPPSSQFVELTHDVIIPQRATTESSRP